MKGNVIQMNTLHLNSVRLNGIGKVQSVSLKGGSTEDPVFPPVEPPVEPEPTPTYTISASVTNGKVSATLNGSAVNLPFTANEGDVIVLEVTPNDGYSFEGWADGNTDNPRSITMTADVVLSAQCVEVVVPSKYIQFEDAEVERVLMSKGVSSDGVGITIEDAERVTSISTWFKDNTAITSFEEFEYFTGVTFLGTSDNQTSGGAFRGCTSLLSIRIPSSVKWLKPGAFANCTSLSSVGDLSHIERIDIYAFSKCPIEEELNLSGLTHTTIGYNAFAASKITKVLSLGATTILGGSTPIGTAAFGKCEYLEEINLEGVQVFQTGALSYCSALKEIIAPSATDVQGYAFYGCESAEIIDLGANVTNIGANAFNKCSALQKVIVRAATPPTLYNINAFTNTNSCPIYVPDASVEAYKTAVNWSSYASRIKGISEYNG